MPQLDVLNFFNQIFWFFICFCLFYFIISFIVVPSISKIIKIRFKKNNSFKNRVEFFSNEKDILILNYNKFLFASIESYNNLLISCIGYSFKWLETNTSKSKVKFMEENKVYFPNLINYYLSNHYFFKIF